MSNDDILKFVKKTKYTDFVRRYMTENGVDFCTAHKKIQNRGLYEFTKEKLPRSGRRKPLPKLKYETIEELPSTHTPPAKPLPKTPKHKPPQKKLPSLRGEALKKYKKYYALAIANDFKLKKGKRPTLGELETFLREWELIQY